MKKIINKNTKGITLVALVVTIIILLILAGITILQLTGSGLFEKAQLAEQKSKNAQEKEDGILSDYENKIGEYVDGSRADSEKIKELEEKIAELEEQKYTLIEATSPSTAGSWVKICDYPEGFTRENCYIVSGNINNYLLPFSTTVQVQIHNGTEGILMFVSSSNAEFISVPVKLLVTKVD